MTPPVDTLVVTGGLGFIGSAFVRRMSKRFTIVNLDAHTYAADPRRIAGLAGVRTVRLDVTDGMTDLLGEIRPRVVVHFAAETHVTRSETDPERFFSSNVAGTKAVLEAAEAADVRMVVHVSTDEVYGPASDHPFTEDEKLPGEGLATSAYARSKALADDEAMRFGERMQVVVVRPTNCFGPWQHPEKAIPRWTTHALLGQKLPVWGDGLYVRDWMFVEDVAAAIELLVDHPTGSDVFNIGPMGEPSSNLEIARTIARVAGIPDSAVYLTEYDRPQHDRRYSIDCSKIMALGWRPETDFERGLRSTIDWYQENRWWWERLVASADSLYSDEQERADA